MKFINYYTKFFESSQSKKIRQYIGYSVVLKWYNANKEKIAKLLNVEPSELADEDTLIKQSYDLVNSVINTQNSGNSGISGTDIPGFESFEKIENNLIHDILHNLFVVKTKEFNKSLSDIEFTESEIVEEIECLAIEESFMKYMNITYPKTDFINANINQLASYLMMSILKNDPERIQKILDKEVEPYLEVYGKKYPVKGTAFETFFDLFKNREADKSFKIQNSKDFKTYMIKLINVGEGIDQSGGDRAQYPDGEYFGLINWHNYDDKKWYIKQNFDELSDGDEEYILLSNDDDNISKWEFDYSFLDGGRNLFKNKPRDIDEKKIFTKIINLLTNLKFDEDNTKDTKVSSLKVYLDSIDYDNEEVKVDFYNKQTGKKYTGAIKIDNIPKYLQPQLQLESLNVAKYKNKEELTAIPILSEFVDIENSWVDDMDKWFEWLNKIFKEDVVYIEDGKFIGIIKKEEEVENEDGDYETEIKYEILSAEDFEDKIRERFNDSNDDKYYSDNHKFIDFEKFEKMNFSEVVRKLFLDSDSISIMRRNFRLGDIIKNNLSIGNITGRYRSDTETIDTKNPKHKYMDFKGSSDPDKSLSKEILTDNGKKMVELLNNFRGYVINNFQKIKADFKKSKSKFSEKDINTFKNLNIEDLKQIESFVNKNFEFSLTIWLNSRNATLNHSSNLEKLLKFFDKFEDVDKLNKLIQNSDDIEYLKNFVNLRGSIKTTKDYYDFKKLINSIGRKDIFKYKNKIKKIKSILSNFPHTYKGFEIRLGDNAWLVVKDFYEKNKSLNKDLPEIKELSKYILKTYFPELDYTDLKIKEFDSSNLIFTFKV